jgi:hypothetical protein
LGTNSVADIYEDAVAAKKGNTPPAADDIHLSICQFAQIVHDLLHLILDLAKGPQLLEQSSWQPLCADAC